jgi:hypothetical protein
MKIIERFKGLSSMFLPEYYKVHDSKSIYSQYLIMEYFPFPTLS